MFESPRLGALTLPLILVALVATPLTATGCTSDPLEAVEETDSAAKVGREDDDCFPRCKQQDFNDLVNVGKDGKEDLDTACANLIADWKDPVKQAPPKVNWPGWDPKKPICIGHNEEIKKRKDCNRLVDAPGWTPCKNQLMLVCSWKKKKGFGQIILVPPTDGFPAPIDPPSITDQELACIKQWSCKVKNPSALPKSISPAASMPQCDGPTCSSCDSDWVIEEQAPRPEPVLIEGPSALDAFGMP
ncbi:MAG: hypothetical protein JST00_29845 [Deltaproteobacteria bacterium]|nr:hypothetical protein [Deltaproteobacteria bacterium]